MIIQRKRTTRKTITLDMDVNYAAEKRAEKLGFKDFSQYCNHVIKHDVFTPSEIAGQLAKESLQRFHHFIEIRNTELEKQGKIYKEKEV